MIAVECFKLISSLKDGWHVLCVVYNFSRFRMFCAGSG